MWQSRERATGDKGFSTIHVRVKRRGVFNPESDANHSGFLSDMADRCKYFSEQRDVKAERVGTDSDHPECEPTRRSTIAVGSWTCNKRQKGLHGSCESQTKVHGSALHGNALVGTRTVVFEFVLPPPLLTFFKSAHSSLGIHASVVTWLKSPTLPSWNDLGHVTRCSRILNS